MYFLIVTRGQIIYKYMFNQRQHQKFGGSRRGNLTKFHLRFSLKSCTAMAGVAKISVRGNIQQKCTVKDLKKILKFIKKIAQKFK